VSPIDPQTAAAIAQRWLDAFNAHRADLVVEHFADDVTARSPVIARLRPDSGGHLEGKPAVLSYYEDGLRAMPDLHFTLVEVLTGIGQLTILYRNQRDVLVAETLSIP
jgi:ketosteroid isomerase-like protein